MRWRQRHPSLSRIIFFEDSNPHPATPLEERGRWSTAAPKAKHPFAMWRRRNKGGDPRWQWPLGHVDPRELSTHWQARRRVASLFHHCDRLDLRVSGSSHGRPTIKPGVLSVSSPPNVPVRHTIPRRCFLSVLSSMGLSGGLFPGALWAGVQDVTDITPEVIANAERIAGISFSPGERAMMVARLRENLSSFDQLRRLEIPAHVAPVLRFDPTPQGDRVPEGPSVMRASEPESLPDPSRPVDLAFASLTELGALLRAGSVTSLQLTQFYLDRLRRFDRDLRCVVTVTEELALEQAARADRDLDAGRSRGPLHGIPWGAKDLLATHGYPTTWGATPYRDQRLDTDATVVKKLEGAGAVLVAKLTLGALARGDRWFGGRTRNPWNVDEGSSGSSAGPAAATAAGLVGFSIGSETVGSIVSPSARCGATGLRPSFGRVSRYGAMTLSWTMDKLGPICRSVEDCALVLSAIQGADGLDEDSRDVPFVWEADRGLEGIRVGYLETAFRVEGESQARNLAVLESLSSIGVPLQPVGFPSDFPVSALRLTLSAEAAASFDSLTRSGRDDLLVEQEVRNWPNEFRMARLIPAVEYIQANRARAMLISALQEAWSEVDVVVTPTLADGIVLATNLTGHPAVALPNGFGRDGTPSSISFVGALWKDAEALQVARAFEKASGYGLRRPPLFS